ncbi:polysaccharide pyruvyl transferase family protein [Cellulomonas phragmiteti]|uniref:Polysaccharide pyruvyl transferase domain-containing protein n=1 Tax=Cellulomonas phragmiteti TaxID=478780 RepID=A0ABQ4DHF9_9CELL|nr:polysaccharide pyruvyl transferase family protein [Cellulomonas phragmiteti]GIG38794.1 hypothetical protein Cph01nite_05560 [Cellulomonas phragmiteti]
MNRTFVALGGDFPNIGDAVIRRVTLSWVRSTEPVDAFLATAPDAWLEQVGIKAGDRVYRGRRSSLRWVKELLLSRGRPLLIHEPGEVALDRQAFIRECVLLTACVVAKIKRGRVVFPPRSVARRKEARPWGPTRFVHRTACRVADAVYWREPSSLVTVGIGELAPDVCFGADIREGLQPGARKTIGVSLRGSRPLPSAEWFEGLKRAADRLGAVIVPFAQVESDQRRAAELAEMFEVQPLPWSSDLLAHEEALRRLYDGAISIVSDRLHVLIIGSLSGAVPIELVPRPAEKVARHFHQVRIDDISHDSSNMSASDVEKTVLAAQDRGTEVRLAVSAANGEVRRVAARVRSWQGSGRQS